MKKYEFSNTEIIAGKNRVDLHIGGEFVADYIEESPISDDWWVAYGKWYLPSGRKSSDEIDTLIFRVELPTEYPDYPQKWTAGEIFNLPWEEYWIS